MTNNDNVHRAVGRFFCTFSKVEDELGQALKVIFKIDHLANADVLVACLGDLTKKLNAVWSGIEQSLTADGSPPQEAWKMSAEGTMKRILTINTEWRVPLAHSYLEPLQAGALKLTRMTSQGVLKVVEREWTVGQLDGKSNELDALAGEVRAIADKLKEFTITYATDIGTGPVLLDVGTGSPSAGTAPSLAGT